MVYYSPSRRHFGDQGSGSTALACLFCMFLHVFSACSFYHINSVKRCLSRLGDDLFKKHIECSKTLYSYWYKIYTAIQYPMYTIHMIMVTFLRFDKERKKRGGKNGGGGGIHPRENRTTFHVSQARTKASYWRRSIRQLADIFVVENGSVFFGLTSQLRFRFRHHRSPKDIRRHLPRDKT